MIDLKLKKADIDRILMQKSQLFNTVTVLEELINRTESDNAVIFSEEVIQFINEPLTLIDNNNNNIMNNNNNQMIVIEEINARYFALEQEIK